MQRKSKQNVEKIETKRRENQNKTQRKSKQNVEKIKTKRRENLNKMQRKSEQNVEKIKTKCRENQNKTYRKSKQNVEKIKTNVEKIKTKCRENQNKMQKNQNTHFVFSKFFSENRSVCEIMRKNAVERSSPHITIRRMHIACWIPKATNTQNHKV